MTKAEYNEIQQRTQAMTPDEIKCVLSNVPDGYLVREVVHRYSKMLDYMDAFKSVPEKVEKAYKPELEDYLSWR